MSQCWVSKTLACFWITSFEIAQWSCYIFHWRSQFKMTVLSSTTIYFVCSMCSRESAKFFKCWSSSLPWNQELQLNEVFLTGHFSFFIIFLPSSKYNKRRELKKIWLRVTRSDFVKNRTNKLRMHEIGWTQTVVCSNSCIDTVSTELRCQNKTVAITGLRTAAGSKTITYTFCTFVQNNLTTGLFPSS